MISSQKQPTNIAAGRREVRTRVRLGGTGRGAGEGGGAAEYDIVIHDLSRRGILIDALPGPRVGDTLTVELPQLGAIDAVVRRANPDRFGCEFERPLSTAEFKRAWSGSRIVWPHFARFKPGPDRPAPLDLVEDFLEEPDRWPLPLRVAIAIGLGAGLWALIFLALR